MVVGQVFAVGRTDVMMHFQPCRLVWHKLMAGLVSSQEKYFMDIKDFKIKKSQWLIFIVLSAGLIYITESWLMSLGIILLLMVLDFVLAEFIGKKRGKKDDKMF